MDPGQWLGNVSRNGLRPVPRYDIHEWNVNEKTITVVKVDAIAEPPYMTTP